LGALPWAQGSAPNGLHAASSTDVKTSSPPLGCEIRRRADIYATTN